MAVQVCVGVCGVSLLAIGLKLCQRSPAPGFVGFRPSLLPCTICALGEPHYYTVYERLQTRYAEMKIFCRVLTCGYSIDDCHGRSILRHASFL